MKENYNTAIALLVQLIVKNNPPGVVKALNAAGYRATGYVPQEELEKSLLQLHLVDPDKFFEVMRSIPWNYGHTATNRPEIRDQLIALTGSPDTGNAKGEWWAILLGLVQSVATPSNPGPQPSSSPNKNALIGWGIVGIISLIVIIILATLKTK